MHATEVKLQSISLELQLKFKSCVKKENIWKMNTDENEKGPRTAYKTHKHTQINKYESRQ